MKSTLYLKFIFIYIVFGFLSLFTAATLTENLVSTPIFNRVSNSMYREATMVANNYLPGYFSGELTESDAQMILSGIETQLLTLESGCFKRWKSNPFCTVRELPVRA